MYKLDFFRGNINILRYLVTHDDIAIDVRDDQGCTPLILAAVHNNSISVEILLYGKGKGKGANVLKLDKQGQNVLHKAAKEGNQDVVEAIREFLQEDKWKLRKLMVQEDRRGNTPLMLALDSVITGGTLECLLKIEEDLNSGGNQPISLIKQMNQMKETPMHRACR